MTPDQDRPNVRPAAPGFEPGEAAGPLDMSKDPDRFDPSAPTELPSALDPAYDPDRFRPPGQGQTLTDLLGKAGTQEGERDNYQWAFGLLGVFVFLALVAFLFNNVLTP